MVDSVPCFCVNPECVEAGKERFVFSTKRGYDLVCPKCGANESPLIGALTIIHFMVRDKEGPFRGSGGLRYRLACKPTQAILDTHSGLEAASGELRAVTCVECIAAAKSLDAKPSQGIIAPIDQNGFIIRPGGN